MVTKVAVLDDYQGIASEHFGRLDPSQYDVTYYPDTLRPYDHADTSEAQRDELVKRLEPFDVISTMRERTPFPSALLARLPNLRLLLSNGRHNKAIDTAYCREQASVPVTGSSPSDVAIATATTFEHVITLILGLAHDVAGNDAAVKAGRWQTSLVTGLAGKTLGVVGLGRLGSQVGRVMRTAFGMRVVCWSQNLTQDVADQRAREQGLDPSGGDDGGKTFKVVSREELFATSDVVTLHLLLSERTRGLITSQDLGRMKPSALFVNTARGALVVPDHLLTVLKAGSIQGAALDVFDLEPLPLDSEWRDARWGTGGRSRVIVTPHVAYVEKGVINAFYEQQVEELQRWSTGEPLLRTM